MKLSTRMRISRYLRLFESGGMVLISSEWNQMKAREGLQKAAEAKGQTLNDHLSLRRETHEGRLRDCTICYPGGKK